MTKIPRSEHKNKQVNPWCKKSIRQEQGKVQKTVCKSVPRSEEKVVNLYTYDYKLPYFLGKNLSANDIIWGSLLGDAHCNKRGCITLEGSVIQTPYTFWKWEQLAAAGVLTATSTPRLVHRFDKRTGRWTRSLRFNTLCPSPKGIA